MSGSNPASLMKSILAFRSLHQNSSSLSVISFLFPVNGTSSECSREYLMRSYSSCA